MNSISPAPHTLWPARALRLALMALLGLALSACSSLPRQQQNMGAIYLPLEVGDLDGLPLVYQMQPELWRQDALGNEEQVPFWRAPFELKRNTDHLLLHPLPPGRYRLERLAWVSAPDRGWEGVPVEQDLGGLRYQLEFDLEPGQLLLIPKLGWLAGERQSRTEARYQWAVRELEPEQQQLLLAELAQQRRANQWQLMLAEVRPVPQPEAE